MNSESRPESPATREHGDAPKVRAVGLALPPNYVEQEVLTQALREYWTRKYGNARRLDEFHRAVGVRGRHLALPITDYPELDTFAKTNRAWQSAAVKVGEAAVRSALDRAGL